MNESILMNTLMSNIEAIIYFKDLNGKFTMVNQKFLDMFDFGHSDIVGSTFYGALTERIAAKHRHNDQQIIKSNKVMVFEETAMQSDGLHYFISVKFPVLNENNNIIGTGGISTDITDRKQLETDLLESNKELTKALDQVKLLSGFLPICASCKNIRDDKGYWTQIESYIRDHSEAEFSHGNCPECSKKLYPDLHDDAKLK